MNFAMEMKNGLTPVQIVQVSSRKVCARCHGSLWLLSVILVRNGELLAALGTAGSQHAAAVLCGHALTETMLVHAATIVWLKCSFHCNDDYFISTKNLKISRFGVQN